VRRRQVVQRVGPAGGDRDDVVGLKVMDQRAGAVRSTGSPRTAHGSLCSTRAQMTLVSFKQVGRGAAERRRGTVGTILRSARSALREPFWCMPSATLLAQMNGSLRAFMSD
jgi:hypothetical protein